MPEQTFKFTNTEQVVLPDGEILATINLDSNKASLWKKIATMDAQALAGAVQGGTTAATTTAAASGLDATTLASIVSTLIQGKNSTTGIQGLLSALPIIGPILVPALQTFGVQLGDVGGLFEKAFAYITEIKNSGVASTDEQAELDTLLDQIAVAKAKAS